MKHKTVRENDEYACSCGLRWGVREADPHEPRFRPVAGGMLKNTLTGEVLPPPWRDKDE